MRVIFDASDYSDFTVENGDMDTTAKWQSPDGGMSISIGIHGSGSYKRWCEMGLSRAVKIAVTIEPLDKNPHPLA